MRPMSNDELTKHAIRTSADLLELNEKVDDIRRTQGDHTKQFDSHTKRFDDHDKRFDDHDKRFEAIDRRFDEVDKRFEGIDKRLDNHTERLDNIEATQKAHMALTEDFMRETRASFLEVQHLIGTLITRSSL